MHPTFEQQVSNITGNWHPTFRQHASNRNTTCMQHAGNLLATHPTCQQQAGKQQACNMQVTGAGNMQGRSKQHTGNRQTNIGQHVGTRPGYMWAETGIQHAGKLHQTRCKSSSYMQYMHKHANHAKNYLNMQNMHSPST